MTFILWELDIWTEYEDVICTSRHCASHKWDTYGCVLLYACSGSEFEFICRERCGSPRVRWRPCETTCSQGCSHSDFGRLHHWKSCRTIKIVYIHPDSACIWSDRSWPTCRRKKMKCYRFSRRRICKELRYHHVERLCFSCVLWIDPPWRRSIRRICESSIECRVVIRDISWVCISPLHSDSTTSSVIKSAHTYHSSRYDLCCGEWHDFRSLESYGSESCSIWKVVRRKTYGKVSTCRSCSKYSSSAYVYLRVIRRSRYKWSHCCRSCRHFESWIDPDSTRIENLEDSVGCRESCSLYIHVCMNSI